MSILEKLNKIKDYAIEDIKPAIEKLIIEIEDHIKVIKEVYKENEDVFLGDQFSQELSFFNLNF